MFKKNEQLIFGLNKLFLIFLIISLTSACYCVLESNLWNWSKTDWLIINLIETVFSLNILFCVFLVFLCQKKYYFVFLLTILNSIKSFDNINIQIIKILKNDFYFFIEKKINILNYLSSAMANLWNIFILLTFLSSTIGFIIFIKKINTTPKLNLLN